MQAREKHSMHSTYTAVLRASVAALIVGFTIPATFAADASDSGYQAPSVVEQQLAVRKSVEHTARHDMGMGEPLFYKVMLDRFERDFTDKGNFNYIDAQAWVGSSTNRLWLKGEVARSNGHTDDANLEAYFSHAISAYWDAQIGERHDFSTRDTPSRDWLGIGIQGLAPYKFDTDITAYIGTAGRTALRLTSEYDFFITQRLIFWPEVELNLYGKDDPQRNLGNGLANSRIALRLRYEIQREFAPYVGVQWTRKYDGTASYARQSGVAVSDMQIVAGIRIWW